MFRKVSVMVPASTSNLGSGFDSLGLALQLYNRVEMSPAGEGVAVTVRDDRTTRIRPASGGKSVSEGIPRDRSNLVARAADLFFRRTGSGPKGLEIECTNAIPAARGLGSSAACIAAGLMAADALTGRDLGKAALLDLALELEPHPDNLAAAFFGGLTVAVLADGRAAALRVPLAREFKVVAAIPADRLPTDRARKALPAKVPLEDAVFNLSRAAMLVAALQQGRWEALSTAMEDRLHQPFREKLVPGAAEAIKAARAAGAIGAAISGSGPAIVALADDRIPEIGRAMKDAFAARDIRVSIAFFPIDHDGALVLERN
jgi:homoserine kinase